MALMVRNRLDRHRVALVKQAVHSPGERMLQRTKRVDQKVQVQTLKLILLRSCAMQY